jgi:hypothetical protein
VAKSFIANSGAVTQPALATIYRTLATGDTTGTSTETNKHIVCRTAGTFSKLYVRVKTNTLSGSCTVKSRKNAADGNQSITIGAGLTGEFYDDSNTDSVTAGDTFNVSITTGAGTNIITDVIGGVFDATTNTSTILFNNSFSSPFSGTQYTSIIGPNNTATETNAQVRMPTAGTFKNLYLKMFLNNSNAIETVKSRINGINGNLVVSVPAATTGAYEDTSNTDTITENDLVAWAISQNGTGSFWFTHIISANLETTNNNFMFGGGEAGGTLTVVNSGNTRYFINFELETLETDIQTRIFNSHKLSKLWVRINTNATSSSSTFNLRKNQADTALSITIPSGTTGIFTDDSHDVLVESGDEIAMRLVNGGGGNIAFTAWSMVGDQPGFGQLFDYSRNQLIVVQ